MGEEAIPDRGALRDKVRDKYRAVADDPGHFRTGRALAAAREFFADWDRAADDIAAMLRSEAGSNPHDKPLIELIGELST